MGLWRMYSSLDSDINVQGETTLEAPSRVIFGHCDPGGTLLCALLRLFQEHEKKLKTRYSCEQSGGIIPSSTSTSSTGRSPESVRPQRLFNFLLVAIWAQTYVPGTVLFFRYRNPPGTGKAGHNSPLQTRPESKKCGVSRGCSSPTALPPSAGTSALEGTSESPQRRGRRRRRMPAVGGGSLSGDRS